MAGAPKHAQLLSKFYFGSLVHDVCWGSGQRPSGTLSPLLWIVPTTESRLFKLQQKPPSIAYSYLVHLFMRT